MTELKGNKPAFAYAKKYLIRELKHPEAEKILDSCLCMSDKSNAPLRVAEGYFHDFPNPESFPYAVCKQLWLIGSGKFYSQPDMGSIGRTKTRFIAQFEQIRGLAQREI